MNQFCLESVNEANFVLDVGSMWSACSQHAVSIDVRATNLRSHFFEL